MGDWQLIDKDTILYPNDVIEMTFDLIGGGLYTTAFQLYLIEKDVNKNERIELVRSTVPENGVVVITVRVKYVYPADFVGPLPEGAVYAKPEAQEAGILTLGLVIAGIIGAGIFTYLSFREARLKRQADVELQQTPAGQEMLLAEAASKQATATLKTGVGTAGIGLLVVALVTLGKKYIR